MIHPMARKYYSEEFRRDAVELYRVTEGATVAQIAADLGIAHGSLSAWLKAADDALLAAWLSPGAASRGFGVLVLAAALTGAGIAGRHVWLQMNPQSMSCGPGLQTMLELFPLTDVLPKVFRGSGDCAEACRSKLYTMRQARLILGREQDRAEDARQEQCFEPAVAHASCWASGRNRSAGKLRPWAAT